ncbi:hypothetical protein [Nonomuraea sp. SYSU D8015]|uniref:hypothetical protein n=1 Tax=Nonomuraea sp. SYSU D8015 TaxID=2593644 RepID=UPI0016612E7B|nr:hypothetical protein [Nonomuraea sp. SYSU D8015]
MRPVPKRIYPYWPLRHVATPPIEWEARCGGGITGRLRGWTLHVAAAPETPCSWTITSPDGESWARGSGSTLEAAQAFAAERMAAAAGCGGWRTPLVQSEQGWVVATSYTYTATNGSMTGPDTYAPGVILELTRGPSSEPCRHPDDGAQFPSIQHVEDHLVDIGVYAPVEPRP